MLIMTLQSYTRDEVAKFVFEKYGKELNLDLESTKKLIDNIYSDVASTFIEEKVPYNDQLLGKFVIGTLEAIEKIADDIVKQLK